MTLFRDASDPRNFIQPEHEVPKNGMTAPLSDIFGMAAIIGVVHVAPLATFRAYLDWKLPPAKRCMMIRRVGRVASSQSASKGVQG
jgi:hypothetical protein